MDTGLAVQIAAAYDAAQRAEADDRERQLALLNNLESWLEQHGNPAPALRQLAAELRQCGSGAAWEADRHAELWDKFAALKAAQRVRYSARRSWEATAAHCTLGQAVKASPFLHPQALAGWRQTAT